MAFANPTALMKLPLPKGFRASREGGFTLVEAMVALAIACVGMGSVMSLNSAQLRLSRSSRQSNAATLSLQEQVEKMRLADWRKMTNPEYVKANLLGVLPRSAAPLDKISATLTVSAHPDPDACQKMVIERLADGTRVTLASGNGLSLQRLARVEMAIHWKGSDGRPRTRSTTTIISNGGISRMNLPGFGPAGGAPASGDSSQTPSGGGDDTSLDPDAGTTETDGAATPAVTTTGNGNGRGSVNGKSGKK